MLLISYSFSNDAITLLNNKSAHIIVGFTELNPVKNNSLFTKALTRLDYTEVFRNIRWERERECETTTGIRYLTRLFIYRTYLLFVSLKRPITTKKLQNDTIVRT